MALTIISRPEKTLDNGYVSRWNASATPLIYKFSSNAFPVNSISQLYTVTNYYYDSSQSGTVVETVEDVTLGANDYVEIKGVEGINGIHRVRGRLTLKQVVIDFYPSVSFTTGGTIQFYFKGYRGLVRVYAGSPEYHPYNGDGSKPNRYIGMLEVDFDENNEGICDIRRLVKPDMSADFDYDEQNSHHAWTSFYIEYTDTSDKFGIPEPDQFNEDILDNCPVFADFINNSFIDGLNDWLQTDDSKPNLQADWTAGSGKVQAVIGVDSSTRGSNILYQDVQIRTNNKYSFDIDYINNRPTSEENQLIKFRLMGKDSVGNWEIIHREILELGTNNLTFDLFPTKNYDSLGVVVRVANDADNPVAIELDKLSVSSDAVGGQCKYSSFALFGAKQFQDDLGGNFGDYVADTLNKGKLLTHFDELKYPFYVNSLIPASTFAASEGGDSLFLETYIFDKQGNEKEYSRQPIPSKSDGVYTVDPNITTDSCEWDRGTTQIVAVPSNLFLDGNGGLYTDSDTNTWNVNTYGYSPQIPNQCGNDFQQDTVDSDYVGRFTFDADEMETMLNPYLAFEFDTEIATDIGETYIIESDCYLSATGWETTQRGTTKVYFGVQGRADSELIIEKATVPTDTQMVGYEKFKLSTTFVASSTTTKVQIKNEVGVDIPFATGGDVRLANTTVKGPIVRLSELKPIKSGVCCGKTSQLVRWKNDLGGWDSWNFTRFRTFKENVNNKIEIQRDITQDFDNYFINGDTEFDHIKQDVRQIITVRSELLTQNESEVLNQIKRSIRVQAFVNNRWVTVIVKGGNYTLYDEDTNIREVSLDLELPRTLTQDQ